MNYKILEEYELKYMLDFIDDENTKYTIEDLKNFINNKNNLGFIAIEKNKITAFAFGYILIHPDGKKVFYLDSIDVLKDYQGMSIGTKLMIYIKNYVKNIDCIEMFLVTSKNNVSACKCYEKSGAVSENKDDVIYVYDLTSDKSINC